MRHGPSASIALPYERGGVLMAEQRRGQDTTLLELLELLTIRHSKIVGLGEYPFCARETDDRSFERVDQSVVESGEKLEHLRGQCYTMHFGWQRCLESSPSWCRVSG